MMMSDAEMAVLTAYSASFKDDKQGLSQAKKKIFKEYAAAFVVYGYRKSKI